MKKLTLEEIFELIDSINSDRIEFDRVRHHNKGEIRQKDSMNKATFKRMVSLAIKEEHQYGGDIEVKIPLLQKTLVGHHDGIYWLEKIGSE
jgi:hypothetical protein